MGALYIDGGLQVVEELVHTLLGNETEHILVAELDRDSKSRFQEWSQAELGITPRYRTTKATGPDHARTFTIAVYVGEDIFGEGQGRSKQAAAQAAAEAALVYARRGGYSL